MPFLISISGLVLVKPILWIDTRHSDIQTLEHTIELGIGITEFCIFCEYLF